MAKKGKRKRDGVKTKWSADGGGIRWERKSSDKANKQRQKTMRKLVKAGKRVAIASNGVGFDPQKAVRDVIKAVAGRDGTSNSQRAIGN